jgi:hypothetical protein
MYWVIAGAAYTFLPPQPIYGLGRVPQPAHLQLAQLETSVTFCGMVW